MNKILNIFVYIFSFLILKVSKEECNKEIPIYKNNECVNIFCTEIEFQNGDCIINNSIIKDQWLNKIFFFGEKTIIVFNTIEMPNNDIILLCSRKNEDFIYIYDLKSSGEIDFKQNDKNYYIIPGLENKETSIINGVGLIINNKQYIFICPFETEKQCQLIDYKNNKIVYNDDLYKFLNIDYNVFSQLSSSFTILNLNKKSVILLSYLEEKSIDFSILNITTNSSYEIIDHSRNVSQDISFNGPFDKYFEISCFITEKMFIECLIAYFDKIKVEIYNESLDFLYSIYLDDIIDSSINSVLCIHLKSEIGVFIYYTKSNNKTPCPLFMHILELIVVDSNYTLKNVIQNETIFKIGINTNDNSEHLEVSCYFSSLIKLSDNKFSYAYADTNRNIIIIALFDLYDNNGKSLSIRYYKIYFSLYNLECALNLKVFKFQSFLGIGFVGTLVSESSSEQYLNRSSFGTFIIFGYSSKKKITYIDLEIYKNYQGFILELNNYFSIENNLFGYDLDIKITFIPDTLKGIRFFSINKKRELKSNELINADDKIIFDLFGVNIQIGEMYVIEITSCISTPKYDKLIQFSDKIDEYGEDFKEYYQRKIVEEKLFKINLNISCNDQSIRTCNYPELTTKIIENNSTNITFFSNYIYKGESNNLLNLYLRIDNSNDDEYCNNNITDNYEYNYNNECINKCPSFYINDSSNICIYSCNNTNQYIFNLKCYDKCPEGTIEELKNGQKICKCKNLFYKDENLNNICLSSIICDDNHPILDEETNECLNYRVKYDNNYYIKCPNNTCICQRYWNRKICEEKTSDMQVFNDICFDDYSSIIDNIEEMANNHTKINTNEGIIISAYSYINDYENNFDKLLDENTV